VDILALKDHGIAVNFISIHVTNAVSPIDSFDMKDKLVNEMVQEFSTAL